MQLLVILEQKLSEAESDESEEVEEDEEAPVTLLGSCHPCFPSGKGTLCEIDFGRGPPGIFMS